MPKISYNKTGGVVRWDAEDWLSGLVPNYSATNNNNNKGVTGFNDQVSIDVYRNVGAITPGGLPVAATNSSVATSALVAGTSVSDYAYLVGGALLHKFDSQLNTLTNDANFPHTISGHHANIVSSDVAQFTVSGTTFVFYSWNDNTDGDVGRLSLASTFDDDYMSTVPSGGAVLSLNPHPLLASRGELFIGNGNLLSSFDGSAFTSARLTLPSGFIIQSMAETQDFLVIFASKNTTALSDYRAESQAFFWDYASSTYTYNYVLDCNLVTAACTYLGAPCCFGAGRSVLNHESRASKFFIYTGGKFEPLFVFKETLPGIGGVEVIGDVLRWNSGGTIMQYGNAYGYKKGINKVAKGTGTTSGVLKNFWGNIFHASSGATTSGGLERISIAYDPASKFNLPVVQLDGPADFNVIVDDVRVTWEDVTGSNCNTLTLILYLNNGQTTYTFVSAKDSVSAAGLVQVFDSTTAGVPLKATQTTTVQIYGQYGAGSSTSAIPPIIREIELRFSYIRI